MQRDGLEKDRVDKALQNILDERIIGDAVQGVLATIRTRQTEFPDQQVTLKRQLSVVETRIRHLVEAIASGRSTESIFTELHKAEAEKKTLVGRLSNLEQKACAADPADAAEIAQRSGPLHPLRRYTRKGV